MAFEPVGPPPLASDCTVEAEANHPQEFLLFPFGQKLSNSSVKPNLNMMAQMPSPKAQRHRVREGKESAVHEMLFTPMR